MTAPDNEGSRGYNASPGFRRRVTAMRNRICDHGRKRKKTPRFQKRSPTLLVLVFAALGAGSLVLLTPGCRQEPSSRPAAESPAASSIIVTYSPKGPVVFKTSAAEFDLLPSGYLQSYLVSNGKRLTLDEPDADAAPESAEINGKN